MKTAQLLFWSSLVSGSWFPFTAPSTASMIDKHIFISLLFLYSAGEMNKWYVDQEIRL